MSYQAKVYRKQGGAELVVADGGKITVESGGAIIGYKANEAPGTTNEIERTFEAQNGIEIIEYTA